MDKKMAIVVAVVAIVAIAAIGAFLLTNNSGNSDKQEEKTHSDSEGKMVGTKIAGSSTPSSESRLWVYGNANEDDRMDSTDVQYIQDIVDKKRAATNLADANADGVVDEFDIKYARSIVDADASTKIDVYYIDNYFEVQKVSWPVKTIATSYCSGLYTAEATGLTSKIAMVDDTIKTYWSKLNTRLQSVPSHGSVESPDWEAILTQKIDVYVPGYCEANADSLARSQLKGMDVMFMNTSDNSGVPYPNEHIDRSILMFGYLLQGDMDKTYKYMNWHDTNLGKLKDAAAGIKEEDKAHFLMSRSYPVAGSSTYSITGTNNTNNLHAEWVGVYAVGQHSNPLLPNNYNSLTLEQIYTLVEDGANKGTNTIYWMDNEHDGLRGQRDLDVTVAAWAEALKSSPVKIHYMGMAREAGNSPLYIIEMAFYQNVLYPDLDTGVDFAQMLNYFIDNFTEEPSKYKQYFDVNNFFKDFGVL